MSRERLYVCMTMDVERINAFYRGGPPTWEFAERSVRSYCGLLAEHGMPATLFVVPDTATHQGKMLREVARETGAELGMHLHPEGWGDHYRNREAYDCLGGYSREEQHRMLADRLFEDVPHLRLVLLHHLLGLLDGRHQAAFLELVVDERLEQLERHLLG